MPKRLQSRGSKTPSAAATAACLPSTVLPFCVLIVFVALHVVPVIAKHSALWGVDQWRYLPVPVIAILSSLGILVLIPRFRAALINFASRLSNLSLIVRVSANRIGPPSILVLALGYLFWRFRNATHLLGDGYVWAGYIGARMISVEPGNSLLYRGATKALNSTWLGLSLTPIAVSVAMSIVSGLFFVVFAYRTARLLGCDRSHSLFVLIAMLSVGTMLLFFGYVEAYPPFAASVAAFVYCGIACLMKRASIRGISIAMTLTLLLHFSAVALLPAFLLVVLARRGSIVSWKRLCAVYGPALMVGLCALHVLQHQRVFSGFFCEKFLPLFRQPPGDRVAYPVFSLKNLADLLNELLLICPMAILAVTALVRPTKPMKLETKAVLSFLGTIVLFYFVECAIFNRVIGASRDWDLFSPIAIPITLIAAIIIIERYSHAIETMSVLVVIILATHTAPWIALNARSSPSEARFVNLITDGFWSAYARGYGYSTLGIYYNWVGDREQAARYSAAAADADKRNPRYLFNLARLYSDSGGYAKAAELYGDIIERHPDHLDARNNLGLVYMQSGRFDLAEKEFEELLRRAPAFTRCYEPLALIYFQAGQKEKCLDLFLKAKERGYDMTAYFKGLGLTFQESAH